MRTLSSALLTELGLSVTRPGFLVQLGFSTTLRLSTMGDISWGGYTWAASDARINGLGQDGSAGNTGNLVLGNTDLAFGALVLNEGASDVPCAIWACYAGATAGGDPVQVFSGVTDGANIDANRVSLALVAQAVTTLYAPRVFINKAAGFNYLAPAGTKVVVGNETFVLDRA